MIGRPHMRRHSLLFILGMILDKGAAAVFMAALAFALGVGGEADTYFVVVAAPLLLAALLGDSFMVVGLRTIAAEDPRHGLNADLVAYGAACLGLWGLMAGCAAPLVVVLAPGKEAAWHARAAGLQVLSSALLPLLLTGHVLAAILIGRGRAAAGILRSAMVNVAGAVQALALVALGRCDAEGLVETALAGAALVDVFLLVMAHRHARPWPGGTVTGRTLAASLRGLALVAGGNLPHNLILVVERAAASLAGEGAISAIAMARSVAPLVGALPAAIAAGQFTGAMASAAEGGERRPPPAGAMIYPALVVGLPVLMVLLAANQDIVAILFQRGRFTLEDSRAVSGLLLLFYLASGYFLLSTPLMKWLQLAGHDRFNVGSGMAAAILHAGLALWWARIGGPGGIVLAYAAATTAQTALVVAKAARVQGAAALALPLPSLLAAAAVSGLAGLVVAADGLLAPGVPRAMATAAAVLVTYALAGRLLRLPGFTALRTFFRAP